MRRLLLILLVVLFPVSLPAQPIGKEFLPPEHWAYRALARFETLGLVHLPGERPYTRDDVVSYASSVVDNIRSNERIVSARDRFELNRLEEEFLNPSSQTDPAVRFDKPLIYASDKPLHLEFDIDLSLQPTKPLDDTRWWWFLRSSPEIRLHFSRWLTWEVRYRLVYGPERDDRVDDSKPSPRERSFKGLTSVYERSYLNFQWKRLTFYAGREYIDWGSRISENLSISSTAGSLDKIGGRIGFLNMIFSFFHSTLSTDTDRHLAGHRLELRFNRLRIGLTETVIYFGRSFEPSYLLPLSSYYANQFNEGRDDNVIWEVDAQYAWDHVTLFGNFLVDDFQFERQDEAPDKIAFDLGARVALVSPIAVTARVFYRYVDIYTYTHEDSLNYYITGNGDPNVDLPLGAFDGPDTDRLAASLAVYPVPSLTTTFLFSHVRRGEGNDWRTHVPPMDPNPSFPSGVVEKTLTFGLRLLWELPGNSRTGFDTRIAHVSNKANQSGVDDWGTSAFFFFTWDF